MIKLTGITDEPIQLHTIPLREANLSLRLRFYPLPAFWTMDLNYKGRRTKGIKLALGVYHLESCNYPFDFVLEDTAGIGIDPCRPDDFSAGRINVYMLEAEDLERLRGYEVPL